MAVTLALRGHPQFNPIISASFLLVISAAAWWAGMGPALVLSFLTTPAITVAASGGKMWLPAHIDPIGIVIFCFISFLVSRVADTRNRVEEVLRTANAELEGRVRERTIELEKANRAIQHRFAELEALYAQLPLGVCFLDTNLRFVRINDTLAAINKAPVSAHLHRHLREMLPAATADVVTPLYESVLQSGEPIVNFEMTAASTSKGEPQRAWLIACSPVKAADGAMLGLQVIVQDISQRKRAEQLLMQANVELAKREKEFRTLANAMPQICWASNADGYVAWYNDRWYEYTGMPHGEINPEQWEITVKPENLRSVRERWNKSLASGEGFEMELSIRGRDERFRWFLVRTVPLRGEDGEIRRWFGTSTDIDELKRSREALAAREQELRRANTDLQQFAYSASHDLQEPIRTIAVYSQMLERRYGAKLDGDATVFLGFVRASALRMERLVRDLLQYVETAHVEERTTESVDAGEVLRDTLANLSATLEEAKAEVNAGPLPALRVRRAHLQQVFQNLVSNAIKYRGTEPPKVQILARRDVQAWVFSVQDNGIGIDPEYKERIFGIFKRLHTTDKYSGTGIGLALCQRIIERYRGRIWVESEPGRGATFFFTVPD